MDAARYEFRIFAPDLAARHAEIRAQYHCVLSETREDIYLLGDQEDCALKIRGGGALDLKCRIGAEGPFELWEPVRLLMLPAEGAALRAAFGGHMRLPATIPETVGTAQEAVRGFEAAPGWCAITVAKTRHQYEAGNAILEFAALMVEGDVQTASLALEAPSAAPLYPLREALGLGAWQNQSYPAFLRQRREKAD